IGAVEGHLGGGGLLDQFRVQLHKSLLGGAAQAARNARSAERFCGGDGVKKCKRGRPKSAGWAAIRITRTRCSRIDGPPGTMRCAVPDKAFGRTPNQRLNVRCFGRFRPLTKKVEARPSRGRVFNCGTDSASARACSV